MPGWLMHNAAYQLIPADGAIILGKVVAGVRPARLASSRRCGGPCGVPELGHWS